jgi:hypothetical protein
MTCTPHRKLLESSIRVEFLWQERDYLKDLSVDGRILKQILNKQNENGWTRFI